MNIKLDSEVRNGNGAWDSTAITDLNNYWTLVPCDASEFYKSVCLYRPSQFVEMFMFPKRNLSEVQFANNLPIFHDSSFKYEQRLEIKLSGDLAANV